MSRTTRARGAASAAAAALVMLTAGAVAAQQGVAPAQGAAAQGAPVQGAPFRSAPVQGAPVQGAPAPAPATAAPALTEQRVVALAMEHNPGLRVAAMEIESARWDVVGEEARYAFVLQLDAGATRTASPGLGAGGVVTSETYGVDAGAELRKHLVWGTDLSFRLAGSYRLYDSAPLTSTPTTPAVDLSGPFGPTYGLSARFSVAQPLLRGAGRDVGEAALLAARVRRTSAEIARDRAASELLRNVLSAYWELWVANAALGIQEQSRRVAQQQRDDAAARARTGSLPPADVLQFETRVATREEDVLNAELERRRRQMELARDLGVLGRGAAIGPPSTAIGLPSEDVPPIPPPPPADAERLALERAAQLRELESALELARVQARTAGDAQRARLDLDAYVQAEGLGNDEVAGALEQLGTFGAVSAHVGLTYETPLDGDLRGAEVARARLAVDIAAERLEEARQGVASEIRLALAQEAAARQKLSLAEETARIAEQQVQAERARFQAGASTPLSILEAEDQLRSAQLRVARARADLLQSSLSIQHLTGRLLAKHGSAAGPPGGARPRPGFVGYRPLPWAF